jgi:hypothetical protein
VTRTRFGNRDENQIARFSQPDPRVQQPGTGQLRDGGNALTIIILAGLVWPAHPYCQSSAPVKALRSLLICRNQRTNASRRVQ